MNLVAGVNASIAAASRQGFAAAAPRVWQAVAALPPSEQDVLRQLLEGMTAAICRDEAPAAQLWQEACLCYLDACSEAQLVGWSWRVDNGSLSSNFKKEAEVELVPFLLHGSRAAIRDVHLKQLEEEEEKHYDEMFQEDPSVTDEGYMEGLSDVAQEHFQQFYDNMYIRDSLLRPLLEAAVRRGAAALPLAVARSLDNAREGSWGGAGAAWAEAWEPRAEAQARFHPRFRRAARALLLANHRGLPGQAPGGGPVHLPPEVMLGILRGMAAPEAEAAWVPLAELPSWIDLNSDM